ncbi:MAG: hypothetical protein Q9176_007850 [Flavoplaca citrina]
MTLPPERIAVKRRRDEEPVDALYIPFKKTKQTLVWNRVFQDSLANGHHQKSPSTQVRDSSTTHHSPGVPTVKTTLPDGNLIASQASHSSSVPPTAIKQTTKIISSQPHEGSRPGSLPPDTRHRSLPYLAKQPRRFHFTPATSGPKSPAIRALSVRYSGIQKHRKKQKKDFAVFVERTCELENLASRICDGAGISKEDNATIIDAATSSAEHSFFRKRPLASPAEQKWRAQTWKQPLDSAAKPLSAPAKPQDKTVPMDDDSDPSLGLARELQHFALEETKRANDTSRLTARTGSKIMPKPPKPRLSKEEADTSISPDQHHIDAVKLGEDDKDPDIFVIDLYVRQPQHPIAEEPAALPRTTPETVDPNKVGLLVIGDEYQEAWELYGEEEQPSDDGWSSDDEDENAEDYYGNDYPEDELDSDDEYDRNTYSHWQSAFDEEDLDDNIDWSNDEPQVKKTWKSC